MSPLAWKKTSKVYLLTMLVLLRLARSLYILLRSSSSSCETESQHAYTSTTSIWASYRPLPPSDSSGSSSKRTLPSPEIIFKEQVITNARLCNNHPSITPIATSMASIFGNMAHHIKIIHQRCLPKLNY